MAPKPKVVIINGFGDVGRSLIEYLLKNDLVDQILVVCKRLPVLAFLLEDQLKLYDDKRVEYRQRNVNDPKSVSACATQEDGSPYDYVFNLETYESLAGVLDDKYVIEPTIALAKECVKVGVKALFKLSTGDVYDMKNNLKSVEDSKIKPRTSVATVCARAEKELMKINNLNLIIMRTAMVYGPSSTGPLTKYLAIANIHKRLGKEMKLLGCPSDKRNTVHSMDVARAAWATLVTKEHQGSRDILLNGKEIYNVCDMFDTDQKKLCSLLSQLFEVSTGFQDSIVSKMASINLNAAADYINSEIKDGWADLCKEYNAYDTPFSPFIDKNFLCLGSNLDSSKLRKTFNFELEYPQPTVELLRETISNLSSIKVWPSA